MLNSCFYQKICGFLPNIGYYNLDGINYTGIPAIPIVFINWCMAISIIPKLAKIREDKLTIEMTNGLRSDVIWVIIFYSFSYIFIFFQYCLLEIWDKICKNRQKYRLTNK